MMLRPLISLALFLVPVALVAADENLGKLSEKYESGGRGPGTVSTGRGDPGGVSYGTYQLASKIGRADAFVKRYYPEEFKGLQGGTPEFTVKWKELAAKDTAGLRKNEHEYIKETHYDPQVKKLETELKLDLSKRSAALRDVVWSVAVQHGPRTDLIVTAVKPLLGSGGIKDVSDEEIIHAVYAERGRKDENGKLVRFRSVGEEIIPALSRRMVNEMNDALEMLRKQESRAAQEKAHRRRGR
jgi:hypothetical protein